MRPLFRFKLYLPIRNKVKQEPILQRIFRINHISAVTNNRGQAVVEYVLLMIVVVSLILGLRGVFSSMNTFMSDMIGGYVSCLMEYGELPSFGIDDSELKQHKDGAGKKCPVPRFSPSANLGGSSTGGTGSGGSGTSNGASNGKNGSGSKSGSSASNGGNGSDGSGGSGGSGSGGSSSGSRGNRGRAGSSPYSRGQISRAGNTGFGKADNPQELNANGKIRAIDVGEGEGSNYEGSSRGRRRSRRTFTEKPKYKALAGKMAEDVQKNVKTPRKPTSTLLAVDEGFRMTVVKRNFTPPERKPELEEKREEEFTFGGFLKWIIIAGIVIACFILFGGQALNYSNSDN